MYCPHIRNAIRVNQDGNLVPCCEFKGTSEFYVGDWEAYKSSTFLGDIESSLQRDIWPSSCRVCMNKESLGTRSLRQTPTQGNSVEVAITNVCNSDCGMCGPDRSSRIASRLKAHPHPEGLLDPELDRFLQPTSPVEKFELEGSGLTAILEDAARIKLIGGEPFLVKKIWKTLDELKNKDVILSIITNGSIIEPEHVEVLRKFKNVSMMMSAEATGAQYEYIRNGLNWKTFVGNIPRLISVAKYSMIVSTISALSITGVYSLAKFSYDSGIDLEFWPVEDPKVLGLQMVSKSIVQDQLLKLGSLRPSSKRNEILLSMFKRYLEEVSKTCPDSNDPRLVSYITYLNHARSGSFLDPTSLQILDKRLLAK